jgi:pre-mRNA-processing factor 17
MVYHNPRYEDLHAPVAGPAHPHRADGVAAGQRNHPTGFVEARAAALRRASRLHARLADAPAGSRRLQDAHVGTFTFDEQYNTFHAYGYGMAPSGSGFVGDADALASNNGAP